ncbi:hypothetical protein HPB49_020895 [Dermacentor silvarum]|uniref:Uncharacterized protein n=1 Tax=Dermacentor silvarum TaxID=543639 RepID=A0ACB8DG54_DERSI|nr:hypothetical protein HPB49_020895 [Dermacentor silvarum]
MSTTTKFHAVSDAKSFGPSAVSQPGAFGATAAAGSIPTTVPPDEKSCSPSSTSQPAALLAADSTGSTTPPGLADVNSKSANDTPNFPSPTASQADDSSAEMDFTASPENSHNTPSREALGAPSVPTVNLPPPPDPAPSSSLLESNFPPLNGKPISVKTYAPNPPISCLGVIHNVGSQFTPAQLMHDLESFTTDILAARMMGTTESVLVTFAGTVIPHFVYFKRVTFRCPPHKPKPPTCTRCLALGHRAHQCPQYSVPAKCRRCAAPLPADPTALLCAGPRRPPLPPPPPPLIINPPHLRPHDHQDPTLLHRSFDLRLTMLERHQHEQQRISHELQQQIHTLTQTLQTTTTSLTSQLTKLNEHISTLITPSSNDQETRTARTVPGYRAYHATTGTPLASVYVLNDVLVEPLDIPSSLLKYLVGVVYYQPSSRISLTLISFYNPPVTCSLLTALGKFLHSLPSTTHLPLGGDFNAPYTLWGYPQTLKPGRLLHCLAQERHLTLNNLGSPTRAGTVSQHSTTPDLTFSRGTLSFTGRSCISAAVSASSRRVRLRHPIPHPDPHFLRLWRRRKRLQRSFRSQPQNAQLSSRIAALRAEIVAHGESLEHARWSALCEGLDSALHSQSTWLAFELTHLSDPHALTRGTPQGAVLCPTLLNIAMTSRASQLAQITDLYHIFYADDITLWCWFVSPGHVQDTLQRGLDLIGSFIITAGLSPATEKSELLLLSHSAYQRSHNALICLHLSGSPIPIVPQCKVIGFPLHAAKNAHALHHTVRTCHSVTPLLRRVVTRRSGHHEAHACRVAHALALNKFLYFVRYVSFTNTQLNTLETALLGLYKAALNLPITTSTANLFATGLFHPLRSLLSLHRDSQLALLSLTRQGQWLLAQAVIYPIPVFTFTSPISTPAPKLRILHLPSNMSPVLHGGCRHAAAQHHHLKPTPAGRSYTLRVHSLEVLAITHALQSFPSLPSLPEYAIYSDSQAAIHHTQNRTLPLSLEQEVERAVSAPQPSTVFLRWVPGHSGIDGNSWPISPPPSEDGGRLSLRCTIKEVYLQLRLDKRLYPPPHPSLTVPEARPLWHVQMNALVTPSLDPSCPNCPSTYADLAHCLFHCPAAQQSHSYPPPSLSITTWHDWLGAKGEEEQHRLATQAVDMLGL